MQPRPLPSGDRYHPPTAPQIPISAIQSLIPRLTTTINDIDAFKNSLGQGAADGSMPNWYVPFCANQDVLTRHRETLLQRYSLLLGRINALSTYLAQPAPPPPVRTGVPRAPPDPRPALERYIVHPLNPLPPSSAADPIAPEAFFQVINTQALPAVTEAQAGLIERREWKGRDELRGLDEPALEALLMGLKGRLEREGRISDGLRGALERAGEEYEWGMRVDGGEDDEDAGDGKKGEEDDDDLFGDDDEETEEVGKSKEQGETGKKVVAPNPREGWRVADYVRYMDTGAGPKVA
jgi:hypothetical protein